MTKLFKPILFGAMLLIAGNASAKDLVKENVDFAVKQIGLQLDAAKDGMKNPGKYEKGKVVYIDEKDWRSGFFAGSLWYLYELTKDTKWSTWAEKYSRSIEDIKNYTNNHDVGFMIYCSFGNGMRLAPQPDHREIIVQTARSLSTRYHEGAGIIQSWNSRKDKDWACPVIIDNMMNLELMYEASKLSGNDQFRKIAVSHTDKTLQNHFRTDGSCYHVIDYDPSNGNIRHRNTHQGYSDESTWTRGHAWAIYGYTLAYRYNKNPRYLAQALKTFNYLKNHVNAPADCIPYWDMEVPNIQKEERDVSAAAIIASALYEMAEYVSSKEGKGLRKYADKILASLSSPAYRAPLGQNGNFLLMHSVGAKSLGGEIDVALNYADYYFLEALKRKVAFEKKGSALATL